MKIKNVLNTEDKVDITPMIDVIFLLLIFFMFLPIQQEADLSIRLPSNLPAPPDLTLPSEQIVDILPNDMVLLNGAPVDNPDSRDMPQLTYMLDRVKRSADRAGINTVVLIQADAYSKHQRSIDVMNACAQAEIKSVSFSAD